MEKELEKQKVSTYKQAEADFNNQQNVQFEQALNAPLVKQEVNDKYNGLTEQEIKEAEALIDPDAHLKQNNVNKKSHWRDIKKVVDNCEVLLYVLDARDPQGSINAELEGLITEHGNKIIYVLNKTDLVSQENALQWIAKFKKDKRLLVPCQANLSIFNKKAEDESI